jgi:hypothetical protein
MATAGAAVDHVQHQLTGWAHAGGEGDGAIAVEQGVVHQGGEALLQAVGVGGGAGGGGAGIQAQAAGGLGGHALVQFEQHVVGQQRLDAQVQAAGIVAGQVEQVGHEGAHALGFLLDQLQGGGLGTAAQQALGVAGDQGDRCAQFVVADWAGLRSQPTGAGA